MKMIMIVYNEAIDVEVMEVLNRSGLSSYTKATRIYGKGKTSGTHLSTQVWPGQNNIVYVACDDVKVSQMISGITNLRKTIGREGVKAFVLPLEQVT